MTGVGFPRKVARMRVDQKEGMPRVLEILIAGSPSAGMEARQAVTAVPGRGLEEDRYFFGIGTFSPHPQKPAYELTLIQQEHIEEFRKATGLPFTARQARRNIVTAGVDLNSMVGRDFSVGEVLLRGIKLCEPCEHLAKTSFPQVMRDLVNKGGLRAQILRGGKIHVGDSVVERSQID